MFLFVALPGVEFIYVYIWATATKVFSLCGFGFMWGPTINDQLALGILSKSLHSSEDCQIRSAWSLWSYLTLPVSCFYFVFGLWGFFLHYYQLNSILKYILKYNFSQTFKVFVRRRSLVFSVRSVIIRFNAYSRQASFQNESSAGHLFPLKLYSHLRTLVWSVGTHLVILLQHMQAHYY